MEAGLFLSIGPGWPIGWLTGRSFGWLVEWLADWPAGRLAGQLAGWPIGWLTDWLADWLALPGWREFFAAAVAGFFCGGGIFCLLACFSGHKFMAGKVVRILSEICQNAFAKTTLK